MRRLCALIDTLGCSRLAPPGQPAAPPGPAYSLRLHNGYRRYDDEFWIWVDDNPDCCADLADLREALVRRWNGLSAGQRAKIEERVGDWLEAHDLHPSSLEQPRDLVFHTVRDRWAAMTSEDQRHGLDGRGEGARARLARRSGVDPVTSERDPPRARARGWRANLSAAPVAAWPAVSGAAGAAMAAAAERSSPPSDRPRDGLRKRDGAQPPERA